MKRLSRLGSLSAALLVGAVLLPTSAFPWGWAAHVHLTQNLGLTSGPALYGAVLPDFAQLLPNTDYLFFLQEQTHEKSDRLVDKAASFGLADLGKGFWSHNEKTGADHTAHVAGFTNPRGTGGYVEYKTNLLLPEEIDFPGGTMTIGRFLAEVLQDNGFAGGPAALVGAAIAPDVAHSAIEDGIDILLQLGDAPYAGCGLLQAAATRDAGPVQALLVKAYAKNFAARFKIPAATAEAVIAGAEPAFQELMAYYGAVLCPLAEDWYGPVAGIAWLESKRLNAYIKAVTGLPALTREVTPEEVASVFVAVPPLVAGDYEDELAATLSWLAGEMTASR